MICPLRSTFSARKFPDHARDLGLADAGRSGEHHVLAERCDRKPLLAALLLDLEPRGQPLDLLLDRAEPDHASSFASAAADRNFVVLRLLAGRQDHVFDRELRDVGSRIVGPPRSACASRVFPAACASRGHWPSRRLGAALDPGPELGLEAVGQDKLLARGHAAEDLAQFVRTVAREVDGLAEAARKSRGCCR
jgi:hypothetical protein